MKYKTMIIGSVMTFIGLDGFLIFSHNAWLAIALLGLLIGWSAWIGMED